LEVADDACGISSATEICGGDGTHMWNKIMLARDMERGFGIEIEILILHCFYHSYRHMFVL